MIVCDRTCIKRYSLQRSAEIITILSDACTTCCLRSFNTWCQSPWAVCQLHLQPTCSVESCKESTSLHDAVCACTQKFPLRNRVVQGVYAITDMAYGSASFDALWLMEFSALVPCSFKVSAYNLSDGGNAYNSSKHLTATKIDPCADFLITVERSHVYTAYLESTGLF